MKKKILFLLCCLAIATPCFAYDYDYYSDSPSTSGWLIFCGFIFFVWGILEIILFFKVWTMTNDVKEMKRFLLKETQFDTTSAKINYLRRNLILGNKDRVKKMLLLEFINNVQNSYYAMPEGKYETVDGKYILVDLTDENLSKPIDHFTAKLEKQFEKIDEPVPAYIMRMKTYGDFFNVFTEDDLKYLQK